MGLVDLQTRCHVNSYTRDNNIVLWTSSSDAHESLARILLVEKRVSKNTSTRSRFRAKREEICPLFLLLREPSTSCALASCLV